MFVENHSEIVGHAFFTTSRGSSARRVQPVLCIHMAESLQVDAHSLKPGFVDELEMALMEARLGEILPQWS